MAATETGAKARRIISLDAFRAATVALMIFMDNPAIHDALPRFLVHPEWHGFRIADLVFPAFVFIVGTSMAFAAQRDIEKGRKPAVGVFIRRIALLFVLGLLLNWVKYGLPLRYMGVLQRIALASVIAWPFARLRARWAVAGALVLLIAYSGLWLGASAPGIHTGSFDREANISGWLDTNLFGIQHTYRQSGFDPEGVLGTIGAASSALIGLAYGISLARWKTQMSRRLTLLAVSGTAALAVGVALNPIIPVNKPLWTTSYVLVAGGLSGLILVAMYWLVDYRGVSWPVRWLVPLGRNALVLYIASNVLKVSLRHVPLPGSESQMVFPGIAFRIASATGEMWASILVSATEVTLWLAVAVVLHWRKIYVKL